MTDRCDRCGWGRHEVTHSFYMCDQCGQFPAEDPCPNGTNQDVACPTENDAAAIGWKNSEAMDLKLAL